MRLTRCVSLLFFVLFLFALPARAGLGGSITGTVKDPAGNVIVGAAIQVKDVNTGRVYQATSDRSGHFNVPVLPVGSYQMSVAANGFETYLRKDITINDNSALTFDVPLAVGRVSDTVTVSDESIHVETTSSQMGEVVSGRQIEAMPLNGRSFTDLLSLQPGVAPLSSITATSVQDVGATALEPSGFLNPGTISVNGQPEGSNVFIVNGSNAEEDVSSGAAVIPVIDSISEFRILTNNFDAQYGQYSGGQIIVVTKSGTNRFRGNVFEFLRNTELDAKNYFSPGRGAFEQNQYGGTLGGPLRHDKIFFFTDFQRTTQTQGIDTGEIGVPSLADRAGNVLDRTANMMNPVSGPTTVSGPYLAGILSQELGYTVSAGEPYYVPGCNTPTAAQAQTCVFPNALIPQSAWSLPAQRLLQYIPQPNLPDGSFATSAYDQLVSDNKGEFRLDGSTRLGLLSGYFYIDNFVVNTPYPVAQSGASIPGFNAINSGRSQMISLGDTKIISSTAVNELHLSFVRDSNDNGIPIGGTGVSLVSQGFVTSTGAPSIVALDPKGQSVENINFNSFSIGAAANQLTQANNSFGVSDVFTKVIGRHNLKTGVTSYKDQVNVHAIAQFNGSFTINGTETGDDFTDFLIGVPTQYNQSQLNPFYARDTYVGLFAQDSWNTAHHLTLNYGVRWDLIEPWTEKYNQISSFVPGEQSVVFPTAPTGLVFPGDPGVPRTLAPIHKLDFSPRFGIVWAPQSTGTGLLSKLLGGPGSTSIRAGFGTFYTSIEALSISVLAANPPYGITYTSPAPPLFSDPFISALDGSTVGQPFPYQFADEHNPAANQTLPWVFNPIQGIPGFDTHNRTPFTQEYMLSLQRQAGRNTILSASYIGTSSHREEVLIENNPGNPALCLSLSQPSEVAPGTLTCGPGGENSQYITASGQVINGTREPFNSDFGSNALQSGIGRASYNALELMVRHASGPLDLIAAYTWGKAMDQSSDIGEEVYPFDPNRSHAISAFSVKNNFVMSYNWRLPFPNLFHPNMLTRGWALSGITHFSGGFPVTIVNPGDNSLIGTNPNGVNNDSIDEPDYNGQAIRFNRNPRNNGHKYFDTSVFSLNAIGTPGTSKRRFFYGPGQIKFDTALTRTVSLPREKSLLFRIEAFNVFNHASFFGPNAVDGDISSSTWGQVIAASPARIMQAVAKFAF